MKQPGERWGGDLVDSTLVALNGEWASTSHIAAMAAFYKNRIGCRDVTSNNKRTLSTLIATYQLL